MSTQLFLPQQFKDLVDLASDATGGFVLYATDDYFAEKENVLKSTAPEWIADRYTDKGKWMDGWESQRRREPGHDFCILRLGMPGEIHGLLVDTTHFKGNAPEAVSLEALLAPDVSTAQKLVDHPAWAEILPRTKIEADHQNAIRLPPSPRVSHVRLHIYPDGGVARVRVYGVVRPNPRIFLGEASVDLAALENGGTIAAVSDQFFGRPENLLLPGRGVNMGDGWETKRRRTPGSDWCVVRLGRRGRIQRIELDTHFFKGNAPQATVIEALDETALSGPELEARLRGGAGWTTLVGRTALAPHRRHLLEPDRGMSVTHLRVQIFPHGGVNRLRVYGHALDTPEVERALLSLNAMSEEEAETLFASFAGARAFAQRGAKARPFSGVGALLSATDEAWWSLRTDDWLEAFAAHPRLGQPKAAPTQTERSGTWSRGEQAGLANADDATAARLGEKNERYYEKFRFSFILFASGKEAAEVLSQLDERMENDRATEIENAAREQAKIMRSRIFKWLLSSG